MRGRPCRACASSLHERGAGALTPPPPQHTQAHARTPASTGRYLEIFARRNNLRNHWVSIGNEVGVGLPESDAAALQQGRAIPGAVWGRGGSGCGTSKGRG